MARGCMRPKTRQHGLCTTTTTGLQRPVCGRRGALACALGTLRLTRTKRRHAAVTPAAHAHSALGGHTGCV